MPHAQAPRDLERAVLALGEALSALQAGVAAEKTEQAARRRQAARRKARTGKLAPRPPQTTPIAPAAAHAAGWVPDFLLEATVETTVEAAAAPENPPA